MSLFKWQHSACPIRRSQTTPSTQTNKVFTAGRNDLWRDPWAQRRATPPQNSKWKKEPGALMLIAKANQFHFLYFPLPVPIASYLVINGGLLIQSFSANSFSLAPTSGPLIRNYSIDNCFQNTMTNINQFRYEIIWIIKKHLMNLKISQFRWRHLRSKNSHLLELLRLIFKWNATNNIRLFDTSAAIYRYIESKQFGGSAIFRSFHKLLMKQIRSYGNWH